MNVFMNIMANIHLQNYELFCYFLHFPLRVCFEMMDIFIYNFIFVENFLENFWP